MGSYAAETRLLMVQGFPEVEDADALETLFSYNLSAPLGSHSEHVRFDCESENGITEDFLIQNMVSVFGDAAEDDLCIFYYCGHGIHNKNNEYIQTFNSRKDAAYWLKENGYTNASNLKSV